MKGIPSKLKYPLYMIEGGVLGGLFADKFPYDKTQLVTYATEYLSQFLANPEIDPQGIAASTAVLIGVLGGTVYAYTKKNL